MTSIFFTITARSVRVIAEGDPPLLDVFRNHLGLIATRFGCGLEPCDAHMVLVDGVARKSCPEALSTVACRHITAIEGFGVPTQPHSRQQAFIDEPAGQCGYCSSGILIAAKASLDRNRTPMRADIAAVLDGHFCRRGTHHQILKAVALAAVRMREQVHP